MTDHPDITLGYQFEYTDDLLHIYIVHVDKILHDSIYMTDCKDLRLELNLQSEGSTAHALGALSGLLYFPLPHPDFTLEQLKELYPEIWL